MEMIKIKDLNLSYDDEYVLKEVDLIVEEGEFLGIIGPNGGGKSSLLKVICGLIKPNSGKVEVLGSKKKKRKNLIGYVPQSLKLDKDTPLTVKEVVLMGRLNHKLKLFHHFNSEDEVIAKNLMNKLGIYKYKERQINQLSGGQWQKVLIARALAVKPKILLLDEPTASIDVKYKSQIYSILEDLKEDMTIIIVTHDLEAISSYVDSIACLNKRLFYHYDSKIENTTIEEVYGCPVDLIAHGVPHRVLMKHREGYND